MAYPGNALGRAVLLLICLLPDPSPQADLPPEQTTAVEAHEPAGMAVCAVAGEPSIGLHDEDRVVAWEEEQGEHGAPRGGGWLGESTGSG
jgi:hypothetical protein